jgi:small subunit ribosomal protein S5
MIRATMDGLRKEQSPRAVAQRRGKKVADILSQPKIDEQSDISHNSPSESASAQADA